MRAEDMVDDYQRKTELKHLRRRLMGIHSIYEITVIAMILTGLFLWFHVRHDMEVLKNQNAAQLIMLQKQHEERMNGWKNSDIAEKDFYRRTLAVLEALKSDVKDVHKDVNKNDKDIQKEIKNKGAKR